LFRSVGLVVLWLLWLPSVASAAVVNADVRETEDGVVLGFVRFTAAPGESNQVTVRTGARGIVFSDAVNLVRAQGDCRRLSAHTARCPTIEGTVSVRLFDGDDAAEIRSFDIDVRGGEGDDVLRGFSDYDSLTGGPGNDVLLGRGSSDQLSGGPGRDRLVGGPGDDTLIDGETDAEAARDTFIGGTEDDGGPGDMVSYAKRRRPLGIDLQRGTSSTEDRLVGVESITAGSGDDRLVGDRDENWLIGGVGDDVVHGRRGRDIPQGGTGADRVLGEHGDDVVWGDAGRDFLYGGAGEDFVISREEDGERGDDQLDCGDASDTVRSDSADTLTGGCESLSTFSNGLNLPTLPAIDADSARFSLRCSEGSGSGSCSGTLTLSRLDGELLGTVHFSVPDDSTATQVAVPLIPATAGVLVTGTTVQVDLVPDDPTFMETGGYRMFMQAQ
jgi:Ca2+-binding RTX toxin-like protein